LLSCLFSRSRYSCEGATDLRHGLTRWNAGWLSSNRACGARTHVRVGNVCDRNHPRHLRRYLRDRVGCTWQLCCCCPEPVRRWSRRGRSYCYGQMAEARRPPALETDREAEARIDPLAVARRLRHRRVPADRLQHKLEGLRDFPLGSSLLPRAQGFLVLPPIALSRGKAILVRLGNPW
jgi:hypothetical protein